jgi:hypothetical protein
VVVIGKNLLGKRHIAWSPFQVDGVGSQVNIDVQAVFQQPQILVPRAEKSLDVGGDFNALLHLGFGDSVWMLNCLYAGWSFKTQTPPDGQTKSSLLTDKPFLCLKVEPAEGARPEVQATTITVEVTPARRQESMAMETKGNSTV